MKLTTNKLYKVRWYDIEHDNDWIDRKDEFKTPPLVTNIWYYLGQKVDGKKTFHYFGSGGDKEQHWERVGIPSGCIVDCTEI